MQWVFCTWQKHVTMEDEIHDYVSMLWGRRQRQDAHNNMPTPISTKPVGKGTNQLGQLDDNSKNGKMIQITIVMCLRKW